MNLYNLTQTATLFESARQQNQFGALEHTLKSIAQCYITLEFLSTQEEKRGDQTRSITRYKVAMRHRKDVSIGWQLQVNKEQLRITSIDRVSSKKRMLLEAETI